MSLLKKLSVLFLLAGLFVPAYAATGDVGFSACSVFSEADKDEKGDGKEEEEEEEPDCE